MPIVWVSASGQLMSGLWIVSWLSCHTRSPVSLFEYWIWNFLSNISLLLILLFVNLLIVFFLFLIFFFFFCGEFPCCWFSLILETSACCVSLLSLGPLEVNLSFLLEIFGSLIQPFSCLHIWVELFWRIQIALLFMFLHWDLCICFQYVLSFIWGCVSLPIEDWLCLTQRQPAYLAHTGLSVQSWAGVEGNKDSANAHDFWGLKWAALYVCEVEIRVSWKNICPDAMHSYSFLFFFLSLFFLRRGWLGWVYRFLLVTLEFKKQKQEDYEL